MDSKTIGILGGGQLGRMMVEAAHRLNIKTAILDADGSPAKQINAIGDHVEGHFADPQKIKELAAKVDVLTIEIEHVDAEVLREIDEDPKYNVSVQPKPATIALIQDKYLQKLHYIKHGLATSPARDVESTAEALKQVGSEYGYPYMLKSRTNAYDGRGNFVVKDEESIEEALKFLHDRPLYAEKWAKFDKELAVMVVRDLEDGVHSYPTVETIHKDNICHIVYAPARASETVQFRARELAESAVKTFSGAGIFGVEMFEMPDGSLLINEIAPRPHNSGHYTQDGSVTSQFEAHIRAVAGLPLPDGFASMSTPGTKAIMLNILGAPTADEELEICRRALETPGAIVHLYGKSSRNKRKMGHVNIVSGSMQDCEVKLAKIMGAVPAAAGSSSLAASSLAGISEQPLIGIIMGSDSDLPVMQVGANILKSFGIPFEVKIVSAHRTPHRMTEYATSAAKRGLKAVIAGAGGAAHLPGMVAAMTTVPVIGVPVKGSTLDGVDSLHSIVQMPRGIPVATVAINNSTNAALLALRIVSVFMPEYQAKLEAYHDKMEKEVLNKTKRLETVGYEQYQSNAN